MIVGPEFPAVGNAEEVAALLVAVLVDLGVGATVGLLVGLFVGSGVAEGVSAGSSGGVGIGVELPLDIIEIGLKLLTTSTGIEVLSDMTELSETLISVI